MHRQNDIIAIIAKPILDKLEVVEHTFRSGEKIDDVRLEAREMTYLYTDGNHFTLNCGGWHCVCQNADRAVGC